MSELWIKQPIHEVAFEIRFPTMLVIADAAIGHYQAQLNLQATFEKDPEVPQLILWNLANSQDSSVRIKANQLRFAFIERKYNGWREFKEKALHYIRSFPLLARDVPHRFIGLAFRNRLPVAPHGEDPLPLEKYISWSLGGPGHLTAKQTRELSWTTDYQLSGPEDLLRVEISNHREGTTDHEGVEHLLVNLDRRINRLDGKGVEDFLQQAHGDIKEAFNSMLNPNYREMLVSGKLP